MLSDLSQLFTPFDLVVLGQLILATLLGLLIGVERTLAKKEAGMRTFAVVSLGSALFTIASVNALKYVNIDVPISFDPTRIAAQIVTGVGFIGAGVVIFAQSKLYGVTTASGLWLSAAVGMAVGFGLYFAATVATIIALLVLAVLWFAEQRLKHMEISHSYRTNGKEDNK